MSSEKLASDHAHPDAHHDHHHAHSKDDFKRTCFSVSFLLTKHTLLSVILLMVIWSLVKIPMMDGIMADRNMFADDLPKEYVDRIKAIVILSKVIVVILAFFGVLGIIRESVNLLLVFDVFMIIRMISSYYVQYFDYGVASNVMVFSITCLALFFTYLLLKKIDIIDNTDKKDLESNIHSNMSGSTISKATIISNVSDEPIIYKV
ncbi:hypothetical protein HDE_00170 [Halotydeus destructor]|nr:hypothetical protein HDE_07955 [Halotydeus destructor]KAI1309312.1 hypothetical protein HDE_00170 [Halotydeus destructor]